MRVETQPVQMLRLLSEGAFSNLFECSIHPRAVILLAGLVAFIFGLPRPEMPDRIKQRAVDRERIGRQCVGPLRRQGGPEEAMRAPVHHAGEIDREEDGVRRNPLDEPRDRRHAFARGAIRGQLQKRDLVDHPAVLGPHVAAGEVALIADRQALACGRVGIRGQGHKADAGHRAGPVDAGIGLMGHAENPDGRTVSVLLVPSGAGIDEE